VGSDGKPETSAGVGPELDWNVQMDTVGPDLAGGGHVDHNHERAPEQGELR